MVFGISVAVFVLVLITVTLGASVQAMVGLGLGMVSAPIITIAAPELMPGVLLWLACFLPVIHLTTQHSRIAWSTLLWTFPARIPGTAVGVAMVAVMSTSQLGIVVGVMVLVAVLLTWRAVVIPVNRVTLVSAGMLSGITGTTTTIGGPPVALLLQHRPPQEIRDTMAVIFLIGSVMSLVGLAIGGELFADQLWIAIALIPCLLLGLSLGRLLARRVDARVIRPVILLICASSAVVLLVRSIVG